jgi:hypothetical protein
MQKVTIRKKLIKNNYYKNMRGVWKINENRLIGLSANSEIVYSFVYPNKKTNQKKNPLSGWFSTVGPPGLEPGTLPISSGCSNLIHESDFLYIQLISLL